MTICTLSSSSSGNCTIVSNGSTHLLVDAGISLRRIREGLKTFDLTPDDLTGVLVTHEHSDHISGIEMLVKYHKIPIFSSCGTAIGICNTLPNAAPFINGFEIGASFKLGTIEVLSFATPHDACESVGFRMKTNRVTFAYATDLGHITPEVTSAMSGADIAFIESNHDPEMLIKGPYPQQLKKRIVSKYGHLSNNDCGSFAVLLAQSGTKKLQLSHLSRENNTPVLAAKTVKAALLESGVKIDVDISVDVALPFAPSRTYEI